MSDQSSQDAKEIFQDALELPAAERLRFVAERCGANTAVRAEVERLLEAHGSAGGFLSSPTGPAVGDAPDSETVIAEAPGTRIGPYKLLQVIGEGGFGVVYMAEQEQPIRRRVALKIIKLGMDTKEVIARFEAERQALALMDHPNIAKVFDAGATESGRPYFVMELVKGVSITEYSDENQLSTRERLELFVDVCKALHHAHEKGIIHRDIKPSNVLVTLHDGTPVPKVIDFGIAKAMNQPLTEKTLFTAFGEFVGTPWCMSPEQAAMSGLEIDRRCDVYALGVLLYELLTGTTPFEAEAVRSRTFYEIMRIIREEDPPTPSARLDTLGKRLAEVATRRRAEPQALAKLIRGDLDWVVMKAMEKDRRRRYGSAVELADDLSRYFRHEPVTARKPSAAYRMQKFARRRRGPLLVAAGISVAVIAGGAVGKMQGVATSTKPGPPSLRLVYDSRTDSAVGGFTRDGRHRLRYSQSRRGYEYVEIASGKTKHLIPVRPDIAAGWRQMNLSPDGRMLAIVIGGAFADSNAAELRLFSVGGDQNGRPIYRWKLGVIGVRVFGWSPDQNRVWVYSGRYDEESRADIESIELSTGSLHTLKTFENRPYLRPPSLSPDGRLITWHAVDAAGRMFNDPNAGATDIFLLSTDGKQEVRVSHPARDETPMFVPDGSGVVFRSSRTGGDLWFLPIVDGRPSGEPRASVGRPWSGRSNSPGVFRGERQPVVQLLGRRAWLGSPHGRHRPRARRGGSAAASPAGARRNPRGFATGGHQCPGILA
jgi:serine/threonine protein kinase